MNNNILYYFIIFNTFMTCKTENLNMPISWKNIADYNGKIHTFLQENDTEQFVLELPNGISINGVKVFTEEGYMLTDIGDRAEYVLPDFYKSEISFYNKRIAVIGHYWGCSWYHWLLQTLSRLIVLTESHVPYDSIYIYIQHPWQKDSLHHMLAYLNIDPSSIIITDHWTTIQAATLIVPSLPFEYTYHKEDHLVEKYKKPECPTWLLNTLRKAFIDGSVSLENESMYERIYISRSKTNRRLVSNEEQLIPELKNLGFTILNLEDFTVKEQAHIFNKARLIVGPHGAGFSNIIFCKPGYVLIDIEHFFIDVTPRSYFRELSDFTEGIYLPYYVDRLMGKDLDNYFNLNIPHFLNYLNRVINITL